MIVDIILWCGGPTMLILLAYVALFRWMDRTHPR